MTGALYRHTQDGTEPFYPRTTAEHVDVNGVPLSEVLDGMDTAIQSKAATLMMAVELPASGWSDQGGIYVQTVNVSGVLATDSPIVDVDMSGATSETYVELAECWGYVGRVVAGAGSITAYCYENAPTVDMAVVLKVVR